MDAADRFDCLVSVQYKVHCSPTLLGFRLIFTQHYWRWACQIAAEFVTKSKRISQTIVWVDLLPDILIFQSQELCSKQRIKKSVKFLMQATHCVGFLKTPFTWLYRTPHLLGHPHDTGDQSRHKKLLLQSNRASCTVHSAVWYTIHCPIG